jgi:hypothetical protein
MLERLSASVRAKKRLGRFSASFGASLAAPAAPVHMKREVQTGSREKKIVWKNPEPGTDVQRCKKCSDSRDQVKIWKTAV